MEQQVLRGGTLSYLSGKELAFSYLFLSPKRGKFQKDNVVKINVEEVDKVNAHAIGVG